MADLLVSLGMSTDDARDIVSATQLPSDDEVLLVLQQASSSGEEVAAGSPVAQPDGADSDSSGVDVCDADDIPLYSRVTDDLISCGLSPPVPAISGWGSWLTGSGGAGNGGNGGGGRNSGGSSSGGDSSSWGDAFSGARWSRICQLLAELLPVGLAMSLVLPPAALHRIIVSLITILRPSNRHLLMASIKHLKPKGLPALTLSPRTLSMACVPFDKDLSSSNLSHLILATGSSGLKDGNPASTAAFLSTWPASWLPNDAASVGSSALVDPTAWLRSAAGSPLPGSALSALKWLSRLGACPQELARKVGLLAAEAKVAREMEARAAARAVVATAVAIIVAEARFEEEYAKLCLQSSYTGLAAANPGINEEAGPDACVDPLQGGPSPPVVMPDELVNADRLVNLTGLCSPTTTSSVCEAKVVSREGSSGGGDAVVMLTLTVPCNQTASSQVNRETYLNRAQFTDILTPWVKTSRILI